MSRAALAAGSPFNVRLMKFRLLLVIVGMFLVFVAISLLNPLRHSENNIRESLLKVAPIGSDFDVVVAKLADKGYTHPQLIKDSGFIRQELGRDQTVGVSSIHVHLGDYRELPIPLLTDVDAFWGFDGAGKLVDIWIWKTTDGL